MLYVNLMKILQINKLFYPVIGGVEKVVKDIIDAFGDEKNFQIDVLCCQVKGKESFEYYKSSKVMRCSSFGKFLSMPVSISFVLKFIKLHKNYDILHFHYPFPLGEICYILFGSKKVKSIVWWHSDIVRQKFLLFFISPFTRMFLKKVDKIIVATEGHLKHSKYLKDFKDKIEIVPFYVNIEDYKIKSDNQKKLLINLQNGYKDKIKLLFVGRLVKYKGIEILLEAVKDIEGIILFIIGEGNLKYKIEQFIETKNLYDKVKLIKHLSFDELVVYYNFSDIFVLPSIYPNEAFGLVQLEAMACGKPVINTNLPSGVPFVSIDNKTGLTAEPNNAIDLKEKIIKLVNDKDLREKLGKNALVRVKNHFSKKIFINKLKKIYNNA